MIEYASSDIEFESSEDLLSAIESYISANIEEMHIDIAYESSDGNVNDPISKIGDDASAAYKDLKQSVKSNDQKGFAAAKSKLQKCANDFKTAAKNPENRRKALKVAKILAGIAAAILVLITGKSAITKSSEAKKYNQNVINEVKAMTKVEDMPKGKNTYSAGFSFTKEDGKTEVLTFKFIKISDILMSMLKHPFNDYVGKYKGGKEIPTYVNQSRANSVYWNNEIGYGTKLNKDPATKPNKNQSN